MGTSEIGPFYNSQIGTQLTNEVSQCGDRDIYDGACMSVRLHSHSEISRDLVTSAQKMRNIVSVVSLFISSGWIVFTLRLFGMSMIERGAIEMAFILVGVILLATSGDLTAAEKRPARNHVRRFLVLYFLLTGFVALFGEFLVEVLYGSGRAY